MTTECTARWLSGMRDAGGGVALLVPECLFAGRSGVRRLPSVKVRWKAGLLHRGSCYWLGMSYRGCVVCGCAGAERVAQMMWSRRGKLRVQSDLAVYG